MPAGVRMVLPKAPRHAVTVLRSVAILAFFCQLVVPLSAQRPVLVDSVQTPALGSVRTFGLLLPKDYSTSLRYPVLYLLHGYGGGYRDWTKLTDIERYVDTLGVIVVLPDADNSWYINSYTRPLLRYEEYLLHDLLRAVETRYSVDTARRAIAGLSMGGYGAILFGLKHPAVFRFCGSLSGAFSLPHFLGDTVRQTLRGPIAESVTSAFGPPNNLHVLSNDVFRLLHTAPPAKLPFIYMAAGIQDGFNGFLHAHREFADSLRTVGIAYEYHETPGTHSWKYWDREIQPLLKKMVEVVRGDE